MKAYPIFAICVPWLKNARAMERPVQRDNLRLAWERSDKRAA